MATQLISIAKIGGLAGDRLAKMIREWADLRTVETPSEWSPDQWPQSVRAQVDRIASLLRKNSAFPPVIHFVEWIDSWSMGDVFQSLLSPIDGEKPLQVFGDQFEVYGYCLPDDGLLLRRLAMNTTYSFGETQWFSRRLAETIGARQEITCRSLIVVLRDAISALVSDEDLAETLAGLPPWLTDMA